MFFSSEKFSITKLVSAFSIPDSVTTIGGSAFGGCSSLNEITCLAATAPKIIRGIFGGVKQNGILKVPEGSDYSSWMSTNNLGNYNWTVEYI